MTKKSRQPQAIVFKNIYICLGLEIKTEHKASVYVTCNSTKKKRQEMCQLFENLFENLFFF